MVQLSWNATCEGSVKPTTFNGELYLVDAETGERTHVGGVVSITGQQSFSGNRDHNVSAIARPQHLIPELVINCHETDPLDGSPETDVSGPPVTVPPRYGGGSGGGGTGGGDGSGGGVGDPTAPVRSGGCVTAFVGTNGPDTLTGSDGGDVMIGFGGKDRLDGRDDHDCLIGGSGSDRLDGESGSDRLSGGRGADVLLGGPDFNAYNAGAGRDFVDARNGVREVVRCGSGLDRARADRRDRLRSCELGPLR